MPVVAVVGAGVAGLAAALQVERLCPAAQVLVLEGSARVGGKVQISQVAGVAVDEGADSLLRRVPEGLALAEAAGLELTTPVAGAAAVWTRDALRPLPTGTLLGIPADLAALARAQVLSPAGLLRVPLDLALPGGPVLHDVAVGALVARRLGREVVDRLVDPLLGGVYAGRADALSLAATVPQLVGPLREGRSLLRAAQRARGVPAPGPVFAGVRGGLGALPPAVAGALRGTVRLSSPVRSLVRTAHGWALETGSAAHPQRVEADAVVLAVPAAAAARLLAGVSPTAAGLVGQLDYASVALVTLALAGAVPGRGSGYLVPAVEGRTTKAVTFTSRKWGLSGDVALVRASVGRYGETADLQRDDADLVAVVRRELVLAVGPVGAVVDSRVTRWGGALPQYAPGHPDRVAAARRALQGQPLVLAGAAYDGVGVPAVARSGARAGQAAVALLAQNGDHDR